MNRLISIIYEYDATKMEHEITMIMTKNGNVPIKIKDGATGEEIIKIFSDFLNNNMETE